MGTMSENAKNTAQTEKTQTGQAQTKLVQSGQTQSGQSQTNAQKNDNRSQQPQSESFRKFIGDNWGPRPKDAYPASSGINYARARRARLGAQFVGKRLVIPAGSLVVRNNDCDYRFRPHSAFSHLTALGTDQQPDAVLVLDPVTDGAFSTSEGAAGKTATPNTAQNASPTHRATVYIRPRASRSSHEFYGDSRYGELWVGVRPSLEEFETMCGIPCAHIDTLPDALAKDAGQVQIMAIRTSDVQVENLVETVRQQAGLPTGKEAEDLDNKLLEACSELRLRKDEWEIDQLRHAIAATKEGFEQIIKSLPRAVGHPRGERVVEGAFGARARELGNGLGYETIAASGPHAATLHWIGNDGPVRAGDVILVDAGVEVDSLYTADITRTLPVNGKFSPVQAQIYQAVLDAADAAFARANEPGVRFRDIHAAAMEVIAARLEEWGLLPVSAQESLLPEGQYHRRWMVHGTSHHLGIDVHDCAQARREMYVDALLEEGMCFTIEPGLYFRSDDLAVPAEFRGISVRIEDDILVGPGGKCERLSAGIPRTIGEVEAWIARIQNS